jgi:hypothetical protein
MRGARVRVTVLAAGLLLAGGCSAPLSGPPSATDVLQEPQQSDMRDAHFTFTYTAADGKTKQSGQGVVQVQPGLAVAMQATTNGETVGSDAAGNAVAQPYTIQSQFVEVGGVGYEQQGQQKWDKRPASTAGRLYAPWLAAASPSYVGEENVSGTATWHVRAFFGVDNLDLWVRQSDGYPVRFNLPQASYTFDRYNTGAQVRPPAVLDVRGDPRHLTA